MKTQILKVGSLCADRSQIALACSLLSVASVFAQTSSPLVPSDARISDQTIGSDRAAYDRLQGELRKRHLAGASVEQPMLAKAQCWLDVSFHEYSRNERDDFPQAALQQTQALIALFDKSPTAAMAPTPLIAGAKRIREDLWQRAARISGDPSLRCAAAKAACAEVALVHAGHEEAEYGWRSARPYVGIAEDAVSSASAMAASCNVALPAKPAAIASTPQPSEPPRIPLPQVRRIVLYTDTLFDFDKADIKPESGNKGKGWKAVVPEIRQLFSKVDSVRVFGHTDRIGSDNHNDPLSWRRAKAVSEALRTEGLTEVVMEVYGMGKREPKVECQGQSVTPALIQCLQPSRRVEIEVTGWPK